MTKKYFLHTIREHNKHTKKDAEELVVFLNSGCEIMQEFYSDDEHHYIILNTQEEVIKEAN